MLFRSETRRLPIGPLAPIEPVHVDAPPPPDPPAAAQPPPPPVVEKRPPTPPLKYAAVASASTGLVALAVGTVYAFRARSKWADAKAHDCDGNGVCRNNTGVELVNDAGSKATIATISWVAGVALIGGGAAMWFLAPSPGKREPALTPDVSAGRGGVHISLRGTL